ncbi:hypothetical protein [Pseudodonghicola flavimaris]|uniref:DUF1353 domain-containing protein n=1 Tax=Pseudodonghicola flavimaris TaxID=3050036 RepID=A0ABT7F4V4_9RHOB|nr:hypothetical protein [Pseudodonghicola flavimaris]MDK3019617.1 hypothetical protein [Pseudodonghicola flavimaris]
MRRLSLLFPLLLAACGWVDYDALPEGEIKGTVFVMWVGEGSATEGAGKFVYVPNPRDPLRLVRGDGAVPKEIRPEMIYTDGGSIPRAGQMFNGFSPWGYAPAYMIHDWLFVARHCLTDDTPTQAERAIADMEFKESAEIIGEAIQALIASGQVAANDVAPQVIAGAVAGPISYSRWRAEGACTADRVSDAHRAQAEAAIPGTGLRGLRAMTDAKGAPLAPARIITTLSF